MTIGHHRYAEVHLRDFLLTLCARIPPKNSCDWSLQASPPPLPDATPGKPMTIGRLIARLDALLTPELSVVCDVGDCLFAALDLRVHERSHFLASASYTSMGFAVPAALGAQIASPFEPTDSMEWGSVPKAWWTHKIKELHRNDFIMAAKTDRL